MQVTSNLNGITKTAEEADISKLFQNKNINKEKQTISQIQSMFFSILPEQNQFNISQLIYHWRELR